MADNESVDRSTPDNPGATDLFAGARAIEGLLSDDLVSTDEEIEAGRSKGGDKPPPDDEEESEKPEGDEDDDSDDGDEPDDEEDDEADDEPSDDEPESLNLNELKDRLVTVKVDGEEVEVTLEEALAGYQRQQAFTRKTTAVAEERKALREEAERVASDRARYQESLQVVERALAGSMGEEPNWEQLKAKDPAKYAELRVAFQERREQIEAVRDEMQRTQQEAVKEFEAERARLLETERDLLTAKIPEWTDPDVASEEKVKLVEVAQSVYGFGPESIANVLDHRLILLLRDAARFHELTTKQDKVKGDLRKKKRKSPTLKPGTPKGKKQKKGGEARKRLAQTGRLDDAAAAIAEILDM